MFFHRGGVGGSGADELYGGAGADTLNGGAGADTLTGGSGAEALTGGSAAEALDGGTGTDTADYSASALAVIVSLDSGTGSAGDANGDTLVNIEDLVGSAVADPLAGAAAFNVLTGYQTGRGRRGWYVYLPTLMMAWETLRDIQRAR